MNTLSASAPEAPSGAHTGASFTGDVRILIVEDDDADAYLITRALSDNSRVGAVVRAVDGVEAMDVIANGFEPDLAIIDLHMPRKNGFNLLLELNCAEWTFPKIVLTSSTVGADAVRSRLRGASEVLIKPDSVEDLEKMLGAAIGTA